MNLKAAFLYSSRLVFSRSKNKENSTIGKKSLLGAMICIGISLVPLIAILVISEGMISGITGRIIHLSSHDLMVSASTKNNYESCDDFIDAAKKLECIEGVTGIYPEIQSSALASGKNFRTGAAVRAISDDVFETNESFKSFFKVLDGECVFKNTRTAFVGEHIAEILNLKVGDNFTLITMNTAAKTPVPKASVFKVGAIISCGYQELDALWVFIPIHSGFASLAKSGMEFKVGLTTNETFSPMLEKIRSDVQNFLLEDPKFSFSYVETWNEINAAEFENFASTKSLLLVVMILIVLVASINISSALIMIVMERKKEIAILKSVGASSKGIVFAFLFTGFFCGLGGVFIGVPLGLLISVNINPLIHLIESCVNFFGAALNSILGVQEGLKAFHVLDPAFYLQEIPVVIPGKEIILISILTLILSVIVSAIPSVKAGKEKPIDTLRKI